MFGNLLKEIALAAEYMPLLMELAAEEQAIKALQPGEKVALSPLSFGKYVLEGDGATGIQVRRTS